MKAKYLIKTMQAIALVLFLLPLNIFFSSNVYGQNQNSYNELKKYNMESGIIEYKMTGISTGTQTIYFENWGLHEVTYKTDETKIMGVTSKNNSMILIDGEWIYNIDLDSKSGTKSRNMTYEELQKATDNTDANDIMMKDMNGVKIGKEDILGKSCDVWEIKKMGTKTWVWNGIPMKNSTNIAGFTMDMVVTKFVENAKIPPDKFKIPEDVRIVDTRFTKDEIQK